MKRLIDLIVSCYVLIIASPLLLIVALAVRVFLGKPVFFKQQRAGKYGIPFQIIKFRTMTNRTDANGKLLPNDQRFCKFGNFLRSTSLDELPQLVNVVKGDLSLVGPRPLHMSYNVLYNDEQRQRLTVTPGITGLAQINGRNNISWQHKFQYDTWYVKHQSTILDIYILFKTMTKVLKRSDITPQHTQEVESFNGHN